ncbi:MAG TPA: peptidoglycan-binding domain-containing protein [Acidimicrobiales bacterium]|nr:peptidoglycan-binding domain-containing protein [Acidimicrobiales bacterium]
MTEAMQSSRLPRLAALAVASTTGPRLEGMDPTLFDSLRTAAAAQLLLASLALGSVGLAAAADLAEPKAPIELGLQRVLTDIASGEPSVAVVPPSPEQSAPVPAVRSSSAPANDSTRLHRIAAPVRPAPAVVVPETTAELGSAPPLMRLSRREILAAIPPLPNGAGLLDGDGDPVVVPADAGALPLGMGMWLYVPEEIEGGSVDALVARARQVGLNHVYVRTGSSRGGFYAQDYMNELLPKAHAAGIRVYGWDFPYLDDVGADVDRAVAAVTYTTPSGDRLDGFAADIETASEGTNLTAEGASAYSQRLRAAVGDAYPLVAVVPRPSSKMQTRYPYQAVIPFYDAVAPMTYWLNRQPDTDVVSDVNFLSAFGKPVIPIGQAYDGAPEGGRPGPPPPDEIRRFLAAAQQVGAAGTSFWSWQHANQAIWDTLQAAPEFRWEAKPPSELRPDQVRSLQAQLTSLGYPVPVSGTWDGPTTDALRAYQEKAGLPRSGVLDASTLAVLIKPFNPPVAALVAGDGGGIDLGVVNPGG